MKKSMKTIALTAALGLTLALPATVLGVKKAAAELETATVEETLEAAVLKQGSNGSEVREVQRRLKLWGYYNGSVDGVFGAGTKAAVISFQKRTA